MALSESIPTYRQLNEKGFFCPEGYLIEVGEAFEFDGEPNDQMEPLNEPARKKLMSYFKKLDEEGRKYAEKHGRQYLGRAKTLDELVFEATADARRMELRKGDGGVPLMGGKGDGVVKKVTLDATPRITPLRRRPGGQAATIQENEPLV